MAGMKFGKSFARGERFELYGSAESNGHQETQEEKGTAQEEAFLPFLSRWLRQFTAADLR